MATLKQFTVRQKTMAATIVLVLVLLTITLISLASFSTTQEKLTRVTSQYQPKMLSALQLTSHFYHSLTVLGNYLIEKDDYNMNLYRKKVEDINNTLLGLVELTNQTPELEDAEHLSRIRALVDKIIDHNTAMLQLAQNNSKNMPAIGIAKDVLEPTASNINTIINDLLVSTEINNQANLVPLIENLRFNWTMLVSEVRNYLAFRNEVTIEEIILFKSGVVQANEQLTKVNSMLDVEQEDLLEEFESEFETYDDFLAQAISVHASNDWRADRQLMKEQITPTLRELNDELESLVSIQQKRIQASNVELAKQIDNAEYTIRVSIQITFAITLIVVFLSFRNKILASNVMKHAASEREMRYKAHHDSLTGLANRTAFDDQLFDYIKTLAEKNKSDSDDTSAAKGRRQGDTPQFVALLFIDLDGFKAVNDTFGHDAGDFILQQAASRMNATVRNTDIVYRLGGDEFAILLPNTFDQSNVTIVARKLCEEISKDYDFNGQTLNVSASIGISYSNNEDLVSIEDDEMRMEAFVKQADKAMYRAKENGKNQSFVYAG